MKLEILGIHPVEEALDPCHLIELRIQRDADDADAADAVKLDLAGVTQERAGLPGSDWQTPFEEHLLDDGGNSGRPVSARTVTPPARLAFFFHFLRSDRPLLTPVGPLRLPPATPRPARLAFMRYPRF